MLFRATAKSAAALLLILNLLSTLTVVDADAQERLGISRVVEKFLSLKSAVADGHGGFVAVGVLKDTVTEDFFRETAVAWLDAQGQIKQYKPIVAPAGSSGTEPSGILLLPDGTFLVIGRSWHGDEADEQYRDLQGWAARVASSGNTIWSRSYGDKSQEILHAAQLIGPDRVVVVGRSQKSLQKNEDTAEWRCGWSKGLVGVLSWKKGDLNTHMIGNPPTRQAYLGVTSREGDLAAVGFVAGKGSLGDAKCNDDILLARLGQDGRTLHSGVFSQGKGDDLLFDIQPTPKGFVAVGFTSDGKQTKGLVLTADRELKTLGTPRIVDAGTAEASRLDFITAASSSGLFLAGGRAVTKRANVTAFDAVLVTLKAEGTTHRIQVVNSNASQRALGGAFSPEGNAIIVGQAWSKPSTNTEQGLGWVYFLPAAAVSHTDGVAMPRPAPPSAAPPVVSSPLPPPTIRPPTATRPPPQPARQQALSLVELPQRDGLHILDPGKATTVSDALVKATPVRLGFNLSRTTTVRILAKLVFRDTLDGKSRYASVLLLTADGSLIDFSEYGGVDTNIVQASLEPGAYEVRLTSAELQARFELKVEAIQRAPSQGTELNLTQEQRLAISRALSARGYFPGSYPQLGFGAETERAIAAYQSSIGEEITGRLTSTQFTKLIE